MPWRTAVEPVLTRWGSSPTGDGPCATLMALQSPAVPSDTSPMTSHRPNSTISTSTRLAFKAHLVRVAQSLRLTVADAAGGDWGAVTVRVYDEDNQRVTRAQAVELLREVAYPGPIGTVGDTVACFPAGTDSAVPAVQASMRVDGTGWVVTVLVSDDPEVA